MGAGLAAHPSSLLLTAAIMGIAIAARYRWPLVGIGLFLGFLIALPNYKAGNSPVWIAHDSGSSRQVRVFVIKQEATYSIARLDQLDGEPLKHPVYTTMDSHAEGSVIEGRAVLRPRAMIELAHHWSMERRLSDQSLIGHLKWLAKADETLEPTLVQKLREGCRSLVTTPYETASRMRKALFLAEGQALLPEEWRLLNLVSLSHAIVVSGSHLIWLKGVSLPILKYSSWFVPVGMLSWRIVLTGILIFFTFICGEELSLLRALLLAIATLFVAYYVPKIHRFPNKDLLAIVGILLFLWHPTASFQSTYLLSFWTSWVLSESSHCKAPLTYVLPACFAIPLLHWLEIPCHWLGWLCGIFMFIPFLCLIVPLLVAGTVSDSIDRLADNALHSFFKTLSLIEQPLQALSTPHFPGILASTAALIAIAWCLRRKRHKRALLALALYFAYSWGQLIAVSYISEPAPSRHQLSVLDVGQGDALVLNAPGRRFFIDGGSSRVGSQKIIRYLTLTGWFSPSVLALSHLHKSHFGFWQTWAPFFPWKALWTPQNDPRLKPVRNLVSDSQQRWCHQDICMESWRSPPRIQPTARLMHLATVIVRESTKELIALSLGEMPTMYWPHLQRHLQQSNYHAPPQGIAWLKVTRHSERNTASENLMRILKPRVIIVSAGRHNSSGYPYEESLELYESVGAFVIGTSQTGDFKVFF